MPFDELGFQTDTEVTPLSPEHQRVWELIEALESEQKLKDLGQTWFYGDVYHEIDCGFIGCAVGTGIGLGHYTKEAITSGQRSWLFEVADAYGMEAQEARDIFNGCRGVEYPDGPPITPGMVAAKLREWLAGQ